MRRAQTAWATTIPAVAVALLVSRVHAQQPLAAVHGDGTYSDTAPLMTALKNTKAGTAHWESAASCPLALWETAGVRAAQ